MATVQKKFKVGDLVQLKSGGPVMTVSKVPESSIDLYTCQWFAGAKLSQGYFREDELQSPEAKKK